MEIGTTHIRGFNCEFMCLCEAYYSLIDQSLKIENPSRFNKIALKGFSLDLTSLIYMFFRRKKVCQNRTMENHINLHIYRRGGNT